MYIFTQCNYIKIFQLYNFKNETILRLVWYFILLLKPRYIQQLSSSRIFCQKLWFENFRLIFVYLGVCTMLPWNFLLSVTSFWNYKFRNVSIPTDESPVPSDWNLVNYSSSYLTNNPTISPTLIPVIKPTEMQLSFPSYVAIASNIPGAVTTLIHSFYGQRVR